MNGCLLNMPSLDRIEGDTVVIDIDACARCQQPHAGVTFSRMQRPADRCHPFWAICPSGGGPLVLIRHPNRAPR